jgi:hypothetical protein
MPMSFEEIEYRLKQLLSRHEEYLYSPGCECDDKGASYMAFYDYFLSEMRLLCEENERLEKANNVKAG